MRCPKCAKVFVVTKKGTGGPALGGPPLGGDSTASPVKPSPPSPRPGTAGLPKPGSGLLPKTPTGGLPKPNLTAPSPVLKKPAAPKTGIPGPGNLPPPKPRTPPKAVAEIELDLPPAAAEDDFSDIRIPSFAPSAPQPTSVSSAPAPSKLKPLPEEFDLDANLKTPSLAPLPRIPKETETPDTFDFSGFDDPMLSSAPPPSAAPSSSGGTRDTVDLPSLSAPSPIIELDDEDEFSRRSFPSFPAALGLPETSEAISSSGISFHETPALQTIPPMEAPDNFGEIDFGPTVEKSVAVDMDDDAEFDFSTVSSDEESETDDIFDHGSFGEIELIDSAPPAAPIESAISGPAFGSPASFKPAPRTPPAPTPPPPTEKTAIPDSFFPGDATVSSLPPLGAALESYAAPFAGMPSPADLLNLAADPKSHQRTTQDLSRVEGTGTTDYGEVDLSPGETSGMLDIDAEEFDGFPVQRPDSASMPNDLDLAADPMSLRTEAIPMEDTEAASGPEDGHTRGAFEGRRRFERQSRRTKILLLGLLVVATAAGASLSFTSLGPFGANILFRLIPKPVNSQAVAAAKKTAEKKIQQDTVSAYAEAIREVEAAYKEYSSSADLQFFLTYLYYMSEIRFGENKSHDARAKEVLGVAGVTEASSEDAPLAQVSQYLRFSRPVPNDAALTAALKKSSHGLVLLTEVALAGGDTTAALSTAKTLDAKENSPRSGYLAARVFIESGDKGLIAQAVSRLSKIMETQPNHADAGLLLANTMLSQKGFAPEKVREIVGAVSSTLEKTPAATAAQKAEIHAIAAQLFVLERNYAAAEIEIAAAEKFNPENVSMLISKGRIALVRRDYSTAATAFSKATGNAPKNVWAALGKIETEIRGGDLAESQKALLALLPNNNENALAHYLMGEIRIALKENEEGEKELKKAIELDTGLLEAYVRLSTFYLDTGRNDDAMKILDKASELVSGSPLIKKTLAAGHAARGDWASAIVELDNALKIDPADVESHFQMAVMYRKMGSLDDAKRALDEVDKRNADYPGLALEQGLLMEQRGDVASALSAYKKALSLSPNDTGLKLRVGVASFLAGDLETAEKQLAAVLESQPTSPEANFYYGETLRTSKRTAESLGFLLKATELSKDNALYHLRYAMALEETRDNERAMNELGITIRLEPKNAEAYIVMGKIRLRRGAVRDAVQNLEKGLSLDPTLSDGYLAAAEAYEQLSDMSAARKYYHKAAEVRPADPEVHYRLGLAELQVNGKAASYDGFARAAALGDKAEPKPEWFFEALYRRGVAERAKGMRAQAVATFKRYLKEAPENAIDRTEVVANLDDMGM